MVDHGASDPLLVRADGARGPSRRSLLSGSAALLAGGGALAAAAPASAAGGTSVMSRQGVSASVTVARSTGLAAGPGRAYVILARASDLTKDAPEPRDHLQDDEPISVPLFGLDVERMTPGTKIVFGPGADVAAYPLTSSADVEEGEYVVQGFFCTYETNHRSDGSVVQVHWPSGDGGDVWRSPGNVFSKPRKVTLRRGGHVDLVCDQVVAPVEPVPPGGVGQQGNPADSEHVKHVKIRSTLLSDFWGRDVYLGADVLLPQGYDAADTATRYPMELQAGHYPTRNPHGFTEDGDDAFSTWWRSAGAARFVSVTVRSENPFYDDSYNVDSANLGPYGSAIHTELLPELDRRFATIGQPWGRTITGGSTGGWIAAATLVLNPDGWAGAWAGYPDALDFRAHQVVDVYEDDNAYTTDSSWVSVPRPAARAVTGDTLFTMGQENAYEAAVASRTRSQGQWDVWTAVFGPQGDDGYPAPIWDKATGAIDHDVAAAWKTFDLSALTVARWAELAPKIAGRLHVWVGSEDTYFLNVGVSLFEQATSALTPPTGFQFVYGLSQPHGWSPVTPAELFTTMAAFVADHAPAGTDTSAWRGAEQPPAVLQVPGRSVVDPGPTPAG